MTPVCVRGHRESHPWLRYWACELGFLLPLDCGRHRSFWGLSRYSAWGWQGFQIQPYFFFFPWLGSIVWIRLLASLSQICSLHSSPSTGISGALKTFRQLASWSRYKLTGSVCQGQDVPAVLGVCVWVVPPGWLYVWSREIQGCCGLNAKQLPQACVFEHVSRLMVLLGKAVEPWGGRGSQEVGREDV